MAKNFNQKKQELTEIKENLQKATSVVFADFRGIPTESLNKLKNTLFAKENIVAVYKNTLILKGLLSLKMPKVELFGPTALIFSFKDSVSAIKDIYEAKKQGLALDVKQAILEGRLLVSKQVEEVSKLPSKNELLAKVMGGFNSPLVGFVGSISGVQRKLLFALKEISKSKS